MKKINFLAAIAMVAVAGVNVYHATSRTAHLSALQLANLDALASASESNSSSCGCLEGGCYCVCNGSRYLNLYKPHKNK